jgi:putative peptidoglycan lipid II flippase
MKIRNLLKSSSLRDFSSLLFSNILQKIFGLIREPVIAFFFGSSLLYANYLLLRTVADFFSQFTVGNALKANLLPKFTKFFEQHKSISLKKVFTFSKKTMLFLFVLSQLFQFSIILYLDTEHNLLFSLISILLSVSICFNFLNTIYLTIMQAEGKFFDFSIATSLNSFLVVVFIYPLTLLFNLFGLVVSRLIGIISITIAYVIPMNKKIDGFEVELRRKDLNIATLVLGNFANIIILSSRFVSGADGGVSIAYFTYSVFILNALLTAVVGNISTLLLRKVSIKKNNMFMLYSVLISVFMGVFLVLGLEFFGYDLIKLIFMRGEFNVNDVQNTSNFIQSLSYSFVLIFIATSLFQPFFSLDMELSKVVRRNLSLIFISSIIIGFFISFILKMDMQTESLIMMSFTSVVSLVLSGYSYVYYLKINK